MERANIPQFESRNVFQEFVETAGVEYEHTNDSATGQPVAASGTEDPHHLLIFRQENLRKNANKRSYWSDLP